MELWCQPVPGLYTEPCGTHNAITYECFCLMGALSNPKLARMQHQNGTDIYYTYHMKAY